MYFHGDLRPKNWNSSSLFPLTKRVLLPALGFFFLTLSGDSFGLLYWPLCSLFHPTNLGFRSSDSLTSIRYFLQQVGRGVDLHSLLLLWGLLIQTQKGWGNFLFLSSQWESKGQYIHIYVYVCECIYIYICIPMAAVFCSNLSVYWHACQNDSLS